MASERQYKIYFIEDLLLVDNINKPALFEYGDFILRNVGFDFKEIRIKIQWLTMTFLMVEWDFKVYIFTIQLETNYE